jgi:cytochrome c-type biogenesis protein CcsB
MIPALTTNLAEFEEPLMWLAVVVYALGAVLYVVGLVFRVKRAISAATVTSLAGLVPHAAAIAIRWLIVGHAPYLGFYEVVSSYAFVAVAVLGVLVWRNRRLVVLGVIVMPIALLMLGGALMLASHQFEYNTGGKLSSAWLVIHITFAKLSYGSFIMSFALALVYLMRDRWSTGRLGPVLAKLPAQEIVDDLSFKFVAVGLIFLGIMIGAGAIWANEAWGRYWGWDPIETWSLVSWLVYAIYLHLRLTMGWRGRKSAWVAIVALPVVVFALIGVPVVYQSIHGAYLTGYNAK